MPWKAQYGALPSSWILEKDPFDTVIYWRVCAIIVYTQEYVYFSFRVSERGVASNGTPTLNTARVHI